MTLWLGLSHDLHQSWLGPLFVQHTHFIRSRTTKHINSHKLCNLCLFAHDCLFDSKSFQSVVCLIVHRAATIRFVASSRGTPKIVARSLAISLSKFCGKFLVFWMYGERYKPHTICKKL